MVMISHRTPTPHPPPPPHTHVHTHHHAQTLTGSHAAQLADQYRQSGITVKWSMSVFESCVRQLLTGSASFLNDLCM